MGKYYYDISRIKQFDIPEYPEIFARFYDLLYKDLDVGISKDFYLNKIAEAGGPVLEIGTGTGRIFAEALKNGADIYGIENSKNMIDVLRQKLDEKDSGRVMLKDARDFNFVMPFKLIIAPFRMFSHLPEVEDQMKVLNNVYRHLEKDGLFIFDVFVPDLNIIQKGLDKYVDFDGEYETGKSLRRSSSVTSDAISQILNLTMEFEWEEEGRIKTTSWTTKLRYFFLYELQHLVNLSKLNLVGIFDSDGVGDLNTNSKNFVIICKK